MSFNRFRALALVAPSLMALTFGGIPAMAETGGTITKAAPAQAAPLIAREALFGNPSKAQGRLSPDGKWVSFLAPRDGVLNVYVAPASDPSAAKPVTASKDRPIPSHFWAPDSKSILYIQDKGGG